MPPDTIDAVLPLTEADLERSRILIASLDRFFPDLGTCWVVTPDRSERVIREHIGSERYQIISESALIPELSFYRKVKRIKGWFCQQLIKLAIPPHIRSDFYLTLDADVICTKPTQALDLIRNNRGLSFQRYLSDLHAEWYTWAERALGMKRSGLLHGVTPAVLSTEAVILLQQHLATKVNPLMKPLDPGWRGYLLRNLPWTEYTLYFTFLEARGLFDRYHFEDPARVLCAPSVWYRSGFASWDPAEAFMSGAHFVVVQSTATEAQEVRTKVAPFLGLETVGR